MTAPSMTWLAAALARAKRSTLPHAVGMLLDLDGDGDLDADTAIDAIEAALLTLTGELTEAALRNALRPVVEPYAATLDLPWETIADAILAALDGPLITPTADAWTGRRVD